MQTGGVILCGGRSSRMGTAKLMLPFGPEPMLTRIVRLLGTVCQPLAVVASVGQGLPELPGEIIVARDRHEGRGPLEGLLAGLKALPPDVTAAYVTSCDVPLLEPAFVERMIALLGKDSIAVPVSEGFHHPLASVYRTSLVDVIETLLASERRRPADLFDVVATRRVDERELRDVDPELHTLKNLNYPADYLASLALAGFACPPEIMQLFQSQSDDPTRG